MAFLSTRLSQLLEQIKSKDKCKIEEMKSAVAKKNVQSSVDEVSNTLLHYAAEWNNAPITQYLVDLGSRVDAQNRDGRTALMLAAENLCSDTVEILINAGASVLIEDKFGDSILKMIGNSNSTDITSYFVDSLSKRDDIVRILLKNFDLSIADDTMAKKLLEYKWSLPKIILLRNVDITKLMLDRKYLHVNDVDYNFHGSSALHMAVKYADVKNVKLLLDYGAEMNYTDLAKEKPIAYLYAERDISENVHEKLDILKMFIERVYILLEDVDLVDPLSFLHKITLFKERNYTGDKEYSCEEAVELLLKTGLILSAVMDSRGRSVVHFLAENKNPGVIERLHGLSFDVNWQTNGLYGDTPLSVAATHGIPNAVKFLISEGADIDQRNRCNWTPLFGAIHHCYELREQQYRDCVQILLECGAQIEIADLYTGDPDKTVFDVVEKESSFVLAELVVSHLALQEALGTPLTELIKNKIESCKRFKTDFESSRRELQVKVYQSITLLDLLTFSEKKLQRYVRNQEVHAQLKDYSSEACRFYYFKTILQKRMSKAIHIVEMRKKSAQFICRFIKNLGFDRFPLLIGNEIADYLEQEDMKNLFDSIFQE